VKIEPNRTDEDFISSKPSTTTPNFIIKINKKFKINKFIQEALIIPTPNFTPFLLPHHQTP
jgi:hypothetical protein